MPSPPPRFVYRNWFDAKAGWTQNLFPEGKVPDAVRGGAGGVWGSNVTTAGACLARPTPLCMLYYH